MPGHFKFLAICFLFALSSCQNSSSQKESVNDVKEAGNVLLDYYGSEHKRNLMELVADAISSGKKPVLFFTAEWCGPCQQFKKSLSSPLMQDALKDTRLIMIEQTEDQEKIGDMYEISAFPSFVRVGAEGAVLKQTDGGAWQENTPENIAPVFKEFLKD